MSDRILLQITTGPLTGKTFSLGKGDLITIGKDASCQIQLPVGSDIEAKHMHVYFHPKGRLLVKPATTSSTVKINGKSLRDKGQIKLNDRIGVGAETVIVITGWDAAQATQATLIASSVVTDRAAFALPSSTNMRSFALGMVVVVVAGAGFWISRSQPPPPLRAAKALQTTKQSQKPGADPVARTVARNEPPKTNNIQNFRAFIWDEIVNISKRFGDTPPSVMDLEFVAAVEQSIAQYTVKDYHKELLSRRDVYQKMLAKVMRDHQLPSELAYVVWVESKYEAKAQSGAGAAGLWQLLPATAQEYGLTVNASRDERFDPQKSSVAAAKYFQTLLKIFGNDRYLLALAAYNTGQNRVLRRKLAQTVRRSQDADFWHLKEELPKETLDYVPRILAAIIIARNPDRF